jgi:hypothetical protein
MLIAVVLAAVPARPQADQAPNRWMKTPTNLPLNDDIPPAIRDERDRIYDAAIGLNEPLTADSAQRAFLSEGSFDPSQPDIPNFPNRAVVVGVPASARSVLTASGRAVYTEVDVHVCRVFEDVAGHAAPGGDITLTFPGGTVRKPDGTVISHLTQPRTYFIQPGRTYLLAIGYRVDGDFYNPGESWDLTDGVVRPNTAAAVDKARRGKSTIAGLSVEEVMVVLARKFLAPR